MSHELLFTEHETTYGLCVVPVVYCSDGFVE